MPKPLNTKFAWILGVSVFIFSLIAHAPASLLSYAIAQLDSPQQDNPQQGAQGLLLTQTEGSLWAGKTQVAIVTPATQETLGLLEWAVSLRHLHSGQIGLTLSWNQTAAATLNVTSLFDMNAIALEVNQLALQLPASVISAFVPSLSAASLGGQLLLNSEHLTLTQDAIKGLLTVHWNQANSPLSPVNPLGQYQLTLNGLGQALTMQLLTQDGAMQLVGNGEWSKQMGLKFQGAASTTEENKAKLAPLLHIIGEEESPASGQYVFRVTI